MKEYIPFSTFYVPPRFVVRTMQPAEWYVAPLITPEYPPGSLMIDLVSTGAFGSGAHPTTQLCLTALSEFVTPESKVLDIGCGSGVLSIGAARLGARQIVGVDIEQAAVIRTRDNAAMNEVGDRIDVRLGSTEAAVPDAPFDILVGNLLTPIIIKLAAEFPPLLAPDGHMIFSGVLDVQADRVRGALTAAGLTIAETHSQSGWCAFIVTRA